MDTGLCDYGCGRLAISILKNGKKCCEISWNRCPVIKRKNAEGLKKAYADGTRQVCVRQLNGLREWARGKTAYSDPRIKIGEGDGNTIFCNPSSVSTSYIRHIVLKEKLLEYKCFCCGIDKWMGEPIILDLDHKNGNCRDQRIENLRFLCPNCHRQTPTYGTKNRTGRNKPSYTDDELRNVFHTSSNIRQILITLGLSPKGQNYYTVQRRLLLMGLSFSEHVKKLELKPKTMTIPRMNHVCGFCGAPCEGKYCSRICVNNAHRRVRRPSTTELKVMIANSSYLAVARRFGVSDNAIRKWLKAND